MSFFCAISSPRCHPTFIYHIALVSFNPWKFSSLPCLPRPQYFWNILSSILQNVLQFGSVWCCGISFLLRALPPEVQMPGWDVTGCRKLLPQSSSLELMQTPLCPVLGVSSPFSSTTVSSPASTVEKSDKLLAGIWTHHIVAHRHSAEYGRWFFGSIRIIQKSIKYPVKGCGTDSRCVTYVLWENKLWVLNKSMHKLTSGAYNGLCRGFLFVLWFNFLSYNSILASAWMDFITEAPT